jgi:hypothetical protein
MVEEALSVRSADRTQSLADDLRERLVAASARFSQIALELGKGLLYGVEVRRVGRQVQELASLALDQLPDPLPCANSSCPSPPSGPPPAWDTGPRASRSRTPWCWSNPPPPGMLPFPSFCRCWRATLRSCPSCEGLSGAPALHGAPIRIGALTRCSSNTRPRTPIAPSRWRT